MFIHIYAKRHVVYADIRSLYILKCVNARQKKLLVLKFKKIFLLKIIVKLYIHRWIINFKNILGKQKIITIL